MRSRSAEGQVGQPTDDNDDDDDDDDDNYQRVDTCTNSYSLPQFCSSAPSPQSS